MKNKKKRADFWMKLFFFLIMMIIIAAMIYSFFTGNAEFVWYNAIFFILILMAYLLNNRLGISLSIFFAVIVLGLMNIFGGMIFNVTRVYDMVFWVIRYDQIVHFVATFVLALICYSLLHQYLRPDDPKKPFNRFYLFLIMTFMAVGLATVIEMAEFLTVLFRASGAWAGDYNTALDLIANLVGGATGGLVIVLYHTTRRFKKLLVTNPSK